MKDLMDKSSIIKLKEQGYSNRKVEKMLKINRKTIAKYWNEYQTNIEKLNNTKDDLEIKEIQEKIVAEPKYNSKNRVKRKITPEFITALKNILNDELEKEKIFGRKVTSKIYYNKILVYSDYELICEHKKIDGTKKISADIRHYLKTLSMKPGALKNSYALKSNPILRTIYNKYYIQKPKDFIQIIIENKEKSDKEIEKILIKKSTNLIVLEKEKNNINNLTRKQTSMYNQIMIGAVNQ